MSNFVLVRSLPLIAALVLTHSALADQAGSVVRINGTPLRHRGATVEPLRTGDAVQIGEVVETDAAAKVKILLADDSILAIGPKSRVTIAEFLLEPQHRRAQVEVLVGRFKLSVAKFFGAQSDYEIRTPTAVAGVRGTVLWGDTELDAVCALDGRIQVRSRVGTPRPVVLRAGQCVRQMAAGKTTPMKPTAKDIAGYLKDVTLE